MNALEELVENGETSIRSSSFHAHLGHILTKSELDLNSKKAWKYTWEVSAFGSSTAKWKGTGTSCPFKFPQPLKDDTSCGLKHKLHKNWLEFCTQSGGNDLCSSAQWDFFSLCNSYRDVLYANKKPFYVRGAGKDLCVMDAYILHTLNHIYGARDLVTKNDNKLTKNPERNEVELLHGGTFLDRGFTRPKVLLLLPFRSIALRLVKRLIQLTPLPHKNNVEGMDRFYSEFGMTTEDDEETDLARTTSTKPAEFQVLFGGNASEEFMIGIKFTKGCIKLYNDFYSSDIIVASPVQLVQAIGKAEVEKDKDVDYLSSIEIVIMDHADIIGMQNWSHVNSVFEQLNRIPSDLHGTDIMRVRPWYLDGQASFYRQTIILGSYVTPDMNALFNNNCINYEGKVKFVCDHKGVLPKVLLPVKQLFERFVAHSIPEADDARFDCFVKKVFPKIKDSIQGGILLFISSYFDFVRVRNFLNCQSASFCLLGEYTKQSDISRARLWFFNGQRKIMLYTERAHFYHRYKIRGIKNLIFYSLPERKDFYPEVINMVDEGESACTVLFSRFDCLQLERIVGTTACKTMLSSDKDMFIFC